MIPLTTYGQDYPPLDPEGGPHSYYPCPVFMLALKNTLKHLGTKYWIQDPYFSVNPNNSDIVISALNRVHIGVLITKVCR